MTDIVTMTESTTCSRCGAGGGAGVIVRVEFDTDINGYTHRHRNDCKRAAEIHNVMKVIENEKRIKHDQRGVIRQDGNIRLSPTT